MGLQSFWSRAASSSPYRRTAGRCGRRRQPRPAGRFPFRHAGREGERPARALSLKMAGAFLRVRLISGMAKAGGHLPTGTIGRWRSDALGDARPADGGAAGSGRVVHGGWMDVAACRRLARPERVKALVLLAPGCRIASPTS